MVLCRVVCRDIRASAKGTETHLGNDLGSNDAIVVCPPKTKTKEEKKSDDQEQ